MLHHSTATRAALLAMSLLSGCAAADPADINTAAANRPLTAASGAVLVGRFALGRTDMATAADNLTRALAADPGNADLQRQAFDAALLAGRPDAASLAVGLADDPAAMLVRADTDIRAGDWRAAELKFGSLPTQGLTQILRPLLQAWAQQGAGATDQALATLRPYIDSSRFRGLFALHAALICDLAGRTADAARLYRIALVEYGSLNLRLGRLVASWQARNGHDAEARATLHATVQASPDLAIAEPALSQTVAMPQVTSPMDGVAEVYLAMAGSLQSQESADFAMLLLNQALALRPDFSAARLLASDLQANSGQLAQAYATLQAVPPTDPADRGRATAPGPHPGTPGPPWRGPATARPPRGRLPRQPGPGRRPGRAATRQRRLRRRRRHLRSGHRPCAPARAAGLVAVSTSKASPTTARMTGHTRRRTSSVRWTWRPTSPTS